MVKISSILKFAFLLVTPVFSQAQQNDTTKIYRAKVLNKGFYMSYDEFVNNKPSIIRDFKVVSKRISTKDTAMRYGDYIIETDSTEERIPKIWGFCDGQSVFIARKKITHTIFYKLLQLGPYPFFGRPDKPSVLASILTAGFVISATATLVDELTPNIKVEYVFLDEKGEWQDVFSSDMKRLFKIAPQILKAFNDEKDWTPKRKKEYMIMFNDYLISNNIR